MCTAVLQVRPALARCSASMPQSVTSRMNTLKAGSSNWITSTPSASSARASSLRQSAKAKAIFDAVAVMAVGDGVGDRHRAGQGEFQLAPGMRARGFRLQRVDAALQAQRRGDDRHHRLVAVVADSHLDLVREVDAVDPLQKAVHEMLARLFAVADDVDAAILLQLDREDAWRRACLRRAPRPAGARPAHSFSGSASHDGFGRLPAMVVSNMMMSPAIVTWCRISPAANHKASRSAREAVLRPSGASPDCARARPGRTDDRCGSLARASCCTRRTRAPPHRLVAPHAGLRIGMRARRGSGRAWRHPRSPSRRPARGTAASDGRRRPAA